MPPLRGTRRNFWIKLILQKLEATLWWSCMILSSTVFDWSTRMTDRWTDRRTGDNIQRALHICCRALKTYILKYIKLQCNQVKCNAYSASRDFSSAGLTVGLLHITLWLVLLSTPLPSVSSIDMLPESWEVSIISRFARTLVKTCLKHPELWEAAAHMNFHTHGSATGALIEHKLKIDGSNSPSAE